MVRRPLGNSDLSISTIALGTWAMGGSLDSWGPADDRESIAAIQQALDCGINLIDTAPVYGLGHSEELVGKAIQGRRHEVILATKCGLLFPTSQDRPPMRCLAAESILRECTQSLRRLKTEVIDLYQCHWPDVATPIAETMGALRTLLDRGVIRAIGLSNFSCDDVAQARRHGPVHAIQCPFSMMETHTADDQIPYAQEHRLGVLTYSPLARGLLTGRFNAQTPLPPVRARDPEFLGERLRRNLVLIEALQGIAAGYNRTVTQLVINWTASFPGVTAPIVGARRASQVAENATALDFSISHDDRARIDDLLRSRNA